MNISIKKRDILWSYGSMALTMAVNLLLLPLYIYFFTPDMVGLWYVFISIGSIALLFDFGFSITFARNITYCWSGAQELKTKHVVFSESKEVNFSLLKAILKACQSIYAILGGSALVLMYTLGMYYIGSLVGPSSRWEAYIAWAAYGFGIFLNLYYSYYISFLRGVGAITLANKSIVYARLLQMVFTIILLLLGFDIIGASVGYLIYGFGFKLFGHRYFYNYEHIGEKLRLATNLGATSTADIFRTIWYNAWRDGIVSISNYISTQATIIISSFYLSLEQTGMYSIAIQLTTAVAVVASTLYNTYQPAFQNAYITKDQPRLRELFSFSVTLFIVIYWVGVFCLWLIGLPLLNMIKSNFVISNTVLLGAGVMQFIIYYRNCYTSYFSCTNRIIYVKSFIFSSAIGLVLSLAFMQFFNLGIFGLLGGIILSQCMYNSWYWLYKAHKEMRIGWIESIIKGSVIIGAKIKK